MSLLSGFPEDFLFGTATASYQVEGAAAEDGRGPSVWDTFSHTPGRIAMDHTGDRSCDQYHRYREDIALMKDLGVGAYRFSISWSRVFPSGEGAVNEPGLAYYDALVDALLEAGIEPWITFFHWDLPQALEDRYGGWEGRDTAKRFADYVGHVTARLSDRTSQYFTINEFTCFTDAGYASGRFAPGKALPMKRVAAIRHNALLAHGLAVAAIRSNAKLSPMVGLAENSAVCVPVYEEERHIAAAKKAFRELNGAFLTAVLDGAYPDTYLAGLGADRPEFTTEEMRTIGAPLDFVGLNMYTPVWIEADDEGGYRKLPLQSGYPTMDSPWLSIGPQITYWGPKIVADLWNVKAIYITENGCSARDRLTPEGRVYDTERVMYLKEHFLAAARAVNEGVPLAGYFVWSLLDNFEWADGFTKRFGLVYVNFETLERYPKLSADYYRHVIRTRKAV
jgi:beta-glucosidase